MLNTPLISILCAFIFLRILEARPEISDYIYFLFFLGFFEGMRKKILLLKFPNP